MILPSLQERRRNWSVIALTRNPDISNEGVAMVTRTRRGSRAIWLTVPDDIR